MLHVRVENVKLFMELVILAHQIVIAIPTLVRIQFVLVLVSMIIAPMTSLVRKLLFAIRNKAFIAMSPIIRPSLRLANPLSLLVLVVKLFPKELLALLVNGAQEENAYRLELLKPIKFAVMIHICAQAVSPPISLQDFV